jgi:hypothetical protein
MEIKQYEIDGKKLLKNSVKLVSGLIASAGVYDIITRYGKLVTTPKDKTGKKIVMAVGAICLAGMACDAVTKYVENGIDEGCKFIGEVKKAFSGKNIKEDVKDGGCEHTDGE